MTRLVRLATILALLITGVSPLQAGLATQTATTQTAATKGVSPANPILFVTQFPIANDFATIGSTFANHFSYMTRVGRGGDLYIRYPNGSLCNVTRDNGYGEAGVFQGANAIAVRDPHVHWDGTRALFSMVIGAPTQQYQVIDVYWQLYEVTGLGACNTTAITKIANQPVDYNNITPIYSPDGRIVFTSDRPRDGRRHLYPQHDEYESTPTNSGLWSLDPATGDLFIMDHSPSGVFSPIVDSYGRILFSRWDHLQRDQQADASYNGTFTWASEEANAAIVGDEEVFPEPRIAAPGSTVNGLRFNHFFPWMIHPDGTEHETLNHIGRHELHSYFNRSFNDDGSLNEFIDSVSGRVNPNSILNFFQMAEDPENPGTYYGVDAPEFGTHASGRVFSLSAPPLQAPDQIPVTEITHPDTDDTVPDGGTPSANHSGHYREPLPLVGGDMLVVHTAETRAAGNEGSRAEPDPRYDFRIKHLVQNGAYYEAGAALLPGAGIVRNLRYWDPDVEVTYNGPMWELSPVEIRVRPTPPILTASLQAPEAQVFTDEGVDPTTLRNDLRERGLALVVSRNITSRDGLDRQQPFNLRVPGGAQTPGVGGMVYDVQHMQFFQGDQVRGIGGVADPDPGRRVLARVMHDPAVSNPPTSGPPGSVTLGLDGSMAAFVPARRAMTWQLTDPSGEPVVRERYWLTFQPGEIRVCASCHGLSSEDQTGGGVPTNSPEALRTLLQFWKTENSSIFTDGFESGNASSWSNQVGR